MTDSLFYFTLGLFSIMSQPVDVSIVFAGDAMQHIAQVNSAKRAGDLYDYSECFTEVKDYVSSADYAVLNFETTLGGKPYTGYPCFSTPDSYADALAAAGFDLFLNANNHTLDRGYKGLIKTIETLDKKNISHIGTYVNKSSREMSVPYIKNIKGIKIAFLNYTYGTNGIKPTNGVKVNYIDTLQIKQDIVKSREGGAEVITVAIHWGEEYNLLPNRSQKKLADFLCNQGVDLIIGGHPHVIQPMEIRHSEKYNKDCLVVYSLGNFISNMKTTDTRGGAMVKVILERNVLGKVKIKTANYSLVFTLQPDGKHNYRVVPVESEAVKSMKWQCSQFVKNAESIFSKHNVNVKRESAK